MAVVGFAARVGERSEMIILFLVGVLSIVAYVVTFIRCKRIGERRRAKLSRLRRSRL